MTLLRVCAPPALPALSLALSSLLQNQAGMSTTGLESIDVQRSLHRWLATIRTSSTASIPPPANPMHCSSHSHDSCPCAAASPLPAILSQCFRGTVAFTPHQHSPILALCMDSEPISYGLRGKTRAIAAVSDPSSSSVNSQFLAGTCSVRAGNEVPSASARTAQFQRVTATPQVHLIEFDDSSDEARLYHFTCSLLCLPLVQVVCQRVYSHKDQVLDIVASPTSTQHFLSAHTGDEGAHGCTLWSMQDLHSAVVMTLTSPLEALATFPDALAGNRKNIQFPCPTPSRHFATQPISSVRTKIMYIALGFRVFLRTPFHQAALGKQPKVTEPFL
jgi:hypothetical protein